MRALFWPPRLAGFDRCEEHGTAEVPASDPVHALKRPVGTVRCSVRLRVEVIHGTRRHTKLARFDSGREAVGAEEAQVDLLPRYWLAEERIDAGPVRPAERLDDGPLQNVFRIQLDQARPDTVVRHSNHDDALRLEEPLKVVERGPGIWQVLKDVPQRDEIEATFREVNVFDLAKVHRQAVLVACVLGSLDRDLRSLDLPPASVSELSDEVTESGADVERAAAVLELRDPAHPFSPHDLPPFAFLLPDRMLPGIEVIARSDGALRRAWRKKHVAAAPAAVNVRP